MPTPKKGPQKKKTGTTVQPGRVWSPATVLDPNARTVPKKKNTTKKK